MGAGEATEVGPRVTELGRCRGRPSRASAVLALEWLQHG
jgi:hypothetical protein